MSERDVSSAGCFWFIISCALALMVAVLLSTLIYVTLPGRHAPAVAPEAREPHIEAPVAREAPTYDPVAAARWRLEHAKGWKANGWRIRGGHLPDGRAFSRLVPPSGETYEQMTAEDNRAHNSIKEATDDEGVFHPEKWTPPPGFTLGVPSPDMPPPEIKRPGPDAALPANPR